MELQKELAEYLYSSARWAGCQLIIATHSPILLALDGAVVYDLDRFPICTRPWTELENVRSWYAFFRDHAAELEQEIANDPYRSECPGYSEMMNLLRRRGLTPQEAINFCDIVPDDDTFRQLIHFVRERNDRITIPELYSFLRRLRRSK